MSIPQLLTARLLLRGWEARDHSPMAAITGDPRVGEWLGGVIGPDETASRIQHWTDHWQQHGFGLWAVEERDSGVLVGRTGFMHWDDWTASPHDAEIGWTFSSAVWGRGYATEAATAALEWARTQPGLRHIISITFPHNARSRRVMEKLGLTYRGQAVWRGFDPVVWYALELGADPCVRALARVQIGGSPSRDR